jgi:FkbM family methyltransferase
MSNHISLDPESLRTWQDERLERLRYEYELTPASAIIDLGAYQGEWANEIHARYGCQVVVVEPTEYIRDYQHGPIINKAASTHDGRVSFGGRAYYTSAFELGDHEYECFDVNSLLEQYEAIDLLKINIEGAEYDVLNHIIAAGLHPRIKNIQVQFHEIKGVPFEKWYREIESKLNDTHKTIWRYPFCWENWQLK